MQAALELRSIVKKAEQAAAGGDHAEAERLLREALKLQETTVGAQHPDLANTLNNLGVVCEMSGKPADAEQCYRRAYEIVSARLPADHPFIATSRKNLEDFCNARGIPVNRPVPAIPFPAEAPPVPTAPSRRRAPVPAVVYTVVPVRRSVRGFVIAGLLIGALAFGIFFAVRPRIGTSVDTRPSSSSAAPPQQVSPSPSPPPTADPEPAPAAAPAPAQVPAPVSALVPTPVTPPVAPAQTPNARTDPPAAPAAADTRTPTARGPAPTVVSAQLCLNPPGSAWRCDAVSGPVDSRTLFFYTRVASGNDTTIQHRWYQGDRLQQAIELRVRANPAGFRTYSRKTVARDLLGDWRVELRTQDGSVLSQERFVVR